MGKSTLGTTDTADASVGTSPQGDSGIDPQQKREQFARIHASVLQILAKHDAQHALITYCYLAMKADYRTGQVTIYIDKIHKPLNLSERTAWKHIEKLVELGLLVRHQNKKSTNCNYATTFTLPYLISTGVHPDDDRSAAECTAPVLSAALESQTLPSDRPARPAGRSHDRAASVADLPTEALVRRIQQASTSKWRSETVRPLVIAAIERAGVDAVRQLADDIVGAGMQAWEIRVRLQGLSRVSSSAARTPPRPTAPPPIERATADDAGEVAHRAEMQRVLERLAVMHRDPGEHERLAAVIALIATPRPGGGAWSMADVRRTAYGTVLASAIISEGITI